MLRLTHTVVLLLIVPAWLHAINLNREIELHGEWLFEIGDNLDYAHPGFNDSNWERINVPGAWENEGFPGYDGYAWYRISIVIPKHLQDKVLYLQLGQIDDVDRTYVNNRLVGGKGDFPPNYQTAYNVNRQYELPSNFLEFGKVNTIAVRVFDYHGGGGIVHGDIGIYSREDVIDLDIDLSGMWRFKTGDKVEWALIDHDDSDWKLIAVPSTWEQQGYPKHDGFAWYRKKVQIGRNFAREKLILLLGKINDTNQVFLNGVPIGKTGELPNGKNNNIRSHKDEERAYFIPPYLLKPNDINVIAVRVYDLGKTGGIYTGYVGIARRENYLKYTRKKK